MGIIAKNIVVGEVVVQSAPPQPKHVSIFEKIKQQKVVQPIVEPKVEQQSVDNYHHEEHGDLHKLINKKSDYLTDMMALKNNK